MRVDAVRGAVLARRAALLLEAAELGECGQEGPAATVAEADDALAATDRGLEREDPGDHAVRLGRGLGGVPAGRLHARKIGREAGPRSRHGPRRCGGSR